MKWLDKCILLFSVFLLVIALPANSYAADCYLKLRFLESSDGTATFQALEAVYGNFQSEVDSIRLPHEFISRQILLLSQADDETLNEATVLRRYQTGGTLAGVGEGFTPDLPGLGSGTITVSETNKTLYLPVIPEANRIVYQSESGLMVITPLSAAHTSCDKSCLDNGEALITEFPLIGCCHGLIPLVQVSGNPVCSACGDGTCSEYESAETCSADCLVTPAVQECPSGVPVLVGDCASLSAHYTFAQRQGNNLASRKYSLQQIGAVTYAMPDNSNDPAAIFPGGRSFLDAGFFDSLPAATISAWINVKNAEARQALVHIGNLTDSLAIAIVRMTPVFELTSRGTDLEANGETLRRAPTIQSANGRVLFRGRSKVAFSTAAISPGEWHHIALTQEKSSVQPGMYIWRLYVNGTQTSKDVLTNFTPDLNSGSTRLFFGVGPKGKSISNGFYTGVIDDITIWQRALTSAEILLLAEITK